MLASLSITNLPSHFKPYDEPFKVSVDPFKVKDVEVLSSLTNPADQISYLLRGIKLTKQGGIVLDPKILTMMDFFYIGVNRMMVSGFDEIKITAACPQGHWHSYLVKMNAIDIAELDIDVPVYLELSEPVNGVSELVLTPDTVGRALQAQDAGLYEDSSKIKLLALVLTGYKDTDGNYNELSVKDAVTILETLPAYILGPLDHYAAGLSARITPFSFKCKTCGGEFQAAPVENLLDMVKPFRFPESAPGIKVRFGDKRD